MGVNLKYFTSNFLIFYGSGSWLRGKVFVVCTAIYFEDSTQSGNSMLKSKNMYGIQPFFECGVKMAIAFFRIKFSSSKSALRFCSSRICFAVKTVSASI